MRPLPARPTVVVLGGGGGMGRTAVETAAAFDDLGALVVADLDLAAAESVVAECSPTAVTPLRAAAVDLTDGASLAALLEHADVVLNTAGPFYELGEFALRGAIDAGCHYLDICDDWEPTLDLLALHDEAVAADVLAVVGMGASPGLSNLLAVLAARRLDVVDDLYTAWPVDAGAGLDDADMDLEAETALGATAAVIHWMQQISGMIDVVEDGTRVPCRPLAPVSLDFPGLGRGTGYTVGHPEPITLAPRLGVRGRSANLMVLKPSTAAFLDGLRRDIDAGTLSLRTAGEQLLDASIGRRVRAAVRGLRRRGAGALPFFFALARGERAGRPVTVGARVTSTPAGMDGVTSIPLVLALRQLLDGDVEATGVHPPETVVEPEPLFAALAPHCASPRRGFDDLVVLTESGG